MPLIPFVNQYAKVSNIRFLTGVIVSTDGIANTCKVTVLGQTVQDVPMFYHCQHGVVDHAALVFKVGDTVLLLHDGMLAVPSSANLRVIGFPDVVKPCNFGYFIGTYMENSFPLPLTTQPTWLGYVSAVWSSIPGGSNYVWDNLRGGSANALVSAPFDWHGDGGEILTLAGGIGRYSKNLTELGSVVYRQGVVWEQIATTIYGMALVKDSQNAVWTVIVTFDGIKAKRKNDSGWTTLSGATPPNLYIDGYGAQRVFFSGDGTKAVYCTGVFSESTNNPKAYVYDVAVDINARSYTIAVTQTYVDNTYMNGSGHRVGSFECIAFADYAGATKVTCKIKTEHTHAVSMDHNMVPTGGTVWDQTDITTKTTLTTPMGSFVVTDYTYYLRGGYTYTGWDGQFVSGALNFRDENYYVKSIFIHAMDLRKDRICYYSTDYTNTNHSVDGQASAVLRRLISKKYVGGAVIGSRDYSTADATKTYHTDFDLFKHTDSVSDIIPFWGCLNGSTYTSINNLNPISLMQPFYPISAVTLACKPNGKYMVCWAYDRTKASYIYYSDGAPLTMIGKTPAAGWHISNLATIQ